MGVYQINFDIDYLRWSQFFLSIPKPTLSQSWAYGEAKVKGQKWKVMRGIITENKEPIVLIQAWYKKFLFFKFVRVSYGPLWIIKDPSTEQIQGVFYTIKKHFGIRKLSVLSIAPNLENSIENNKVLFDLGFCKRNVISFESGLVDLTPPIHDLRTSLRKNWRRHLNASEKMNLKFIIGRGHADFQWLISCFELFRKEKGFYGHSVALLDVLYQSSSSFHEMFVAYVTKDDEKIAGMLFSCHASSSTPLISWISKKGRVLHAGNFLIWNSVLFSKERGCKWHDLGGTNNSTAFKAGLPNIPYQMIGEYYVFI